MSGNNTEIHSTEMPALQLFIKLGYAYMDAAEIDAERESPSDVLLPERLTAALKRLNPHLDDNGIAKALHRISTAKGDSLMSINEDIYKLLAEAELSVLQTREGKREYRSVRYLDFSDPGNNDFVIANQVRYRGKDREIRPDLVVYVNGLPLAVLECKSPSALHASSEAINDLNYYQETCEKLFYYNQICAALYKLGGRYGAIGAGESYYHKSKPSGSTLLSQLLDTKPSEQDNLIYNLFKREHFIDIIRNFILFDKVEGKTVKKLPRHQQIRAVKNAMERLQSQDKGGVIWHTQGSGKSLTMVYLARKLRREETGFNNPTILVMTDRNSLDRQIKRTFHNCGLTNTLRASSIYKLGQLLKDDYGKIITTTLQKFQETDERGRALQNQDRLSKDGTLVSVKRIIDPSGKLIKITTVKKASGKTLSQKEEIVEVPHMSDKKNLYVFVDEAHRSHYGFLAGFMRKALPNAKFIAFTGTPIDKESKSTLREFYGGSYLDVYSIKESVEDEATRPILYDAGIAELYVDKELLEQQFQEEFSHLGAEKQEKLRRRGASLNAYMNARPRIERIASHIIDHYKTKVYPEGFKGMVVCHSRQSAIAYADAFEQLAAAGVHSFHSRVIMSLDLKKDPEIYQKLATPPEELEIKAEEFTLPFGEKKSPEHGLTEQPKKAKPRDEKKRFNNDALLIVCDMLLTGYDAPIVQVMYLDKVLKEHNLLQAIARVNRPRDGKKFGSIIDYCGITDHLVKALEIYSGELNPGDVMEPRTNETPRLERHHRYLIEFFRHLKPDRVREADEYIEQAILYLEGQDKRDEFKERLYRFNRSLRIVLPDPAAAVYQYDFKLYNEIKCQAANIYEPPENSITKEESNILQSMIDEHLKTRGIEYLLEKSVSIIDRENFRKEIEKHHGPVAVIKKYNRLHHHIRLEMDKDPEFYRPLAERLEELIRRIHQSRLQQLDIIKELNALEEIQEAIINKSKEAQAQGFSNDGEYAVFKKIRSKLPEEGADNKAREITTQIYKDIEGELLLTDWDKKNQALKDIRMKIKFILREYMSNEEMQKHAHELLDILIKNKGER